MHNVFYHFPSNAIQYKVPPRHQLFCLSQHKIANDTITCTRVVFNFTHTEYNLENKIICIQQSLLKIYYHHI